MPFSPKSSNRATPDEWLCGGVSGILAHIFTWLFYGQNFIVDMEDKDRWQMGAPHFELGDPDKGLGGGQQPGLPLTLTNSIHLAKIPWWDWKALAYGWQYTPDFLKNSTFAYVISGEEEAELHERSEAGRSEHRKWDEGPKRDGKRTYYIAYPVEIEGARRTVDRGGHQRHEFDLYPRGLCRAGAGVHRCPHADWVPAGIPVLCWIRETKGTGSGDLGTSFPWDVFPETLTKFYERAKVDGGYSLAWAQGGDLRFGRQVDFDGDTLRNEIDGGPDPDDSKWDADNDGLSDYFEMQIGTKVDGYDPDGDGLNDRDELLLGTNPFRADTDGDGLTDRQERDGWEFAYGFDAAGKPKMTWVTSDPLQGRLRLGDTLTDFQEYNYRYHPRVTSDPKVLGFSSALSERTASGSYVTTDDLVRSGDQLRYEASVENKTLLSSAQGLHAARFRYRPPERLGGAAHLPSLPPGEKDAERRPERQERHPLRPGQSDPDGRRAHHLRPGRQRLRPTGAAPGGREHRDHFCRQLGQHPAARRPVRRHRLPHAAGGRLYRLGRAVRCDQEADRSSCRTPISAPGTLAFPSGSRRRSPAARLFHSGDGNVWTFTWTGRDARAGQVHSMSPG